mgnify:CR=1 FL=1
MKKILLLFIASSLSLFATIQGYDENDFIKVYTKKYKSILYQIENLEHRKLHLQLAHMNVFNEFTHRQFITKWRVKK